jgi:hypothetical protein
MSGYPPPSCRQNQQSPFLLALALALVACGPERPGNGGTGEPPSTVQPATTLEPTIIAEPQSEEEFSVDAGVGLEFDPVSGRLIIPEAGPPQPRPLRADAKLPTDVILREEQAGVMLKATFVPRALPAAPLGPEVNASGIEAAAKLTAPVVAVTLTAIGRMKILFESRALPLPYRSEIRARFERFGNLVFWPGSSRYRILPPGALRTALGERRVDVTPLVSGQKSGLGEGTRLDQPTRMFVLESPLGKVRMEVASLPESGLGGPLLCRALVELVGIDPASPECKPEEVPLFASIDWIDGHGIDFVVNGFERRTDLSPGEALVPPPAATRSDDALPEATDGVYLTREELAAFRSQAIEVRPADPASPPDGFIAENGRDQQMILYLDGVPVVSVPPLDKRFIIGPLRGRYVAQWRTFLGDRIDEPTIVELPGILRSVATPVGADAGPP